MLNYKQKYTFFILRQQFEISLQNLHIDFVNIFLVRNRTQKTISYCHHITHANAIQAV